MISRLQEQVHPEAQGVAASRVVPIADLAPALQVLVHLRLAGVLAGVGLHRVAIEALVAVPLRVAAGPGEQEGEAALDPGADVARVVQVLVAPGSSSQPFEELGPRWLLP